MDSIIESYLNDLNEAKRTSTHRTTRNTKIKKATSQLASISARKGNDPLYKQMVKHRTLYYMYKEKIHKKYSPRVRSQARR